MKPYFAANDRDVDGAARQGPLATTSRLTASSFIMGIVGEDRRMRDEGEYESKRVASEL